MSGTRCEHCGKMTTAGVICPLCTSQLIDALKAVPDMIDQLRITLSRQSKFGAGGGKSTGETPVVFHPKASDMAVQYAKTILRWQGRLADHTNPPRTLDRATPPYRVSHPVRFLNPIAAAMWCFDRITKEGIGQWSDAALMVKALIAVDAEVEDVIDRPEALEFLGDCQFTDDGEPCSGRVYAARDASYGECNVCRGRCDAQQQRLKLLTWLDDQRLTSAEIARMATYLNLSITREQVRKRIDSWHHRGQLQDSRELEDHAAELDPEQDVQAGRAPTFLFADVRRLLEAQEEERQRRAKKAG